MDYFINAKFNSNCAETGAKIRKGERCYYNTNERKVYCSDSKTFQDALNGVSILKKNETAWIDTYLEDSYSGTTQGW